MNSPERQILKEIRKVIPVIIASKIQMPMNKLKEERNLYNKIYISLKKEINEDSRK
jgi:hypothetical protein